MISSLKSWPVTEWLFRHQQTATLWLIIRLYLGWIWLSAGYGKVTNPDWVGANAGESLSGFLTRAIAKADGPRPDVQSWYALFLENIVLPYADIWSYLIAYGEILVGLGLILGLLTGLAAFFGAMMNFNFLLAGTLSSNPLMLVLSIGLILAWRVAGHFGLDRFVLPRLHQSS
ncbi:MAG: TQO small subunit DoxD [Candidatus Paceibacterota bacterium]